MARCPSCDDALTLTMHEGVSLRLCNDCGGTWATHGDLEDLHGGPVDVAVLSGKTEHRCASCRVALVPARLDDRVDVETCTTCRGVFFAEGRLSKFKPPKKTKLQAVRSVGTFVCGKCGKTFPLAQGAMSGGALACRGCAGLDQLDADRADKLAAEGLIEWVAAHRTAFLVLLAIAMGLGLTFVEVFWTGFLAHLLTEAAK